MSGGGGNDSFDAGGGDDTITGGAGNDTIDGGQGTDIAIFSGNQADYTISASVSSLFETITISGIDGNDTLPI